MAELVWAWNRTHHIFAHEEATSCDLDWLPRMYFWTSIRKRRAVSPLRARIASNTHSSLISGKFTGRGAAGWAAISRNCHRWGVIDGALPISIHRRGHRTRWWRGFAPLEIIRSESVNTRMIILSSETPLLLSSRVSTEFDSTSVKLLVWRTT